MLDRHYLRENLGPVEAQLANKGYRFDRDRFLHLDQAERETRKSWEAQRALRNRSSEEIARLRKAGEDASQEIAEMRQVAAEIKRLDGQLALQEEEMGRFLAEIPNLPHPTVPVGPDSSANRVERRWGEPPNHAFEFQDHVDLGQTLGILDTKRATKIAGARFCNYLGWGARLERALISFMLDLHTLEHGYLEVLPPLMANRASLFGTGNLPKFEGDLFKVQATDYYLIPTAEVPITNLFADEILEESHLPLALVAYTACFRSEAGSYGKDTRGLIRQHQFNKVELVRFSAAEHSYQELEKLTAHAESVLRRLELPYRTVTLSSGDMGFSAAKTYDLEVWLPSQNTYREISSCSNFEDFQARRAKIRYRQGKKGTPRLVHTLNGSALAVGRTWVAIVENYQEADGTVTVPKVLRPYLGGLSRLEPEERVGPL